MSEGSFTVWNLTRGVVLVHHVDVAESLLARMRGLLGRTALEVGVGLWIRPCASIHTIGMRFTIDAAFVDAQGRVLRTYRALPPWRVTQIAWGAVGVLELAAGTLAATGTVVGDQLDLGSLAGLGVRSVRRSRDAARPLGDWAPELGVSDCAAAAPAATDFERDLRGCREVLRFLPFSLDPSQRIPVYPCHFEPQ